MSSNLVPRRFDLSHVKGTAMVAMQISKNFCINWTQVIKKRRNFSTKQIPVGLDFFIAKGTAMIAVEILKLSCKIASIKKY